MDLAKISILHHVAIVLSLIWILHSFNCCHPVVYFISLIYLYQVHELYVVRLRKRVQFEERKQANQKRLLSDSESVRWLNHAVEKVWPICMEQIASQKILLPIIPWFLDKYKPWTAKKAVAQHLYLGRNPPVFTEIRVLTHSSDDDHLVLELGMNFLTADDMSAILAVKLRRRLGFGMWAKMHVTGMHIQGKVLVGVKFLREWPFLGRLRVCFVEPPYFQMTVKPIVNHGLDVTELPGIAGWLDKLLAVAFEQTLVEPNMLVVDMEKFASTSSENWFTVDVKDPIAYVKVEVIEAADMKPSDPNGLADPYVKGHLGPYRFRTKTQKKTLAPKWLEEFRIPICTWESPNILALEVRDKDHFVDDTLGNCSININDLRDGQRHDMWISLKNIKIGRLHLAMTVLDVDGKGVEDTIEQELPKKEGKNSVASKTAQRASDSTASSEKGEKMADAFEPINIQGQDKTGIWVHHPGSDVSQTWEPRKRGSRQADIQIHREGNDIVHSPHSSVSYENCNSSSDENAEAPKSGGRVRRSLRKIGSVFHRTPKEDDSCISGEVIPSPRVNLRAVNEREISVNIIRDVDVSGEISQPKAGMENSSSESNETESPRNMKGKAKNFLKQAEHGLKSVLTRKMSRKSKGDAASASTEVENDRGSFSSEIESISSPIQSKPTVEVISTAIPNKPTLEGVPVLSPVQAPDVGSPDPRRLSASDSAKNSVDTGVRNVSFKGLEETANVDHGTAEEFSDTKLSEKISQEDKR